MHVLGTLPFDFLNYALHFANVSEIVLHGDLQVIYDATLNPSRVNAAVRLPLPLKISAT